MLQLLIVDAEEDLLWAVSKNLFADRKDVKIRTASRGEAALETLKQNRVDVLITDTRVSGGIDGFNLILRAKDLAPEAKLIVTTEFSADEEEAFEPTLGVAHFINKPFDINELRDLISDVEKEEGVFRGMLGELALADILALLCLCRRTVLLHLNHRGRRGRIEVVDGVMKHAEFDDKTGEEAVWTMLGLLQGDIFMQGDFERSTPTIEQPWQAILAEAGPWLDEHGLPEQEAAEVEIPIEGWDDEDLDIPEEGESVDENQLAAEANPLGFSEEELKEMVMDDDMGPLEGSAPGGPLPREDTLPRAPMLRPSSQHEIEPPRRSRPVHRGRAALSLKEAVTTLQNELPSFVAASIVQVDEGAAVAGAQSDDTNIDSDSLSAFYGELLRSALKAATAFPGGALELLQIATNEHYILARAIGSSSFAQLAVIGRDANLGIAQVVMRRLDDALAAAVAD